MNLGLGRVELTDRNARYNPVPILKFRVRGAPWTSPVKILSKYMRTSDQEVLNASYDYYVGRVIPRAPYVSEKGLQAVIDFIRQRNPQTPPVKAQDFMDNRFIKELDDGGFIKSLYGR